MDRYSIYRPLNRALEWIGAIPPKPEVSPTNEPPPRTKEVGDLRSEIRGVEERTLSAQTNDTDAITHRIALLDKRVDELGASLRSLFAELKRKEGAPEYPSDPAVVGQSQFYLDPALLARVQRQYYEHLASQYSPSSPIAVTGDSTRVEREFSSQLLIDRLMRALSLPPHEESTKATQSDDVNVADRGSG